MTHSNEEIHTALSELVKSEGWLILRELVDAQFGSDKQLADIGQALQAIPPSEVADFQGVVVPQILASAKGAYTVLALPESHMRALAAGEKGKQVPQLFDRFRRGPRHA